MSFCPNCGRKILDESLGCPVCSIRNTIDHSSPMQEEIKAEPIKEFTVEDGQGNAHRFESSVETGTMEYQKKTTTASDAKIHPALKVIVIALIVLVGGIGAVAGCVAGVVLSKSPAEDYRKFGKLMMTVSVVMLAISMLCCVAGGLFSNATHYMYHIG